MSYKIKTSVGVFTVGDWYLGILSGRLIRIGRLSNSSNLSVVSASGESDSVDPERLAELPPELNGGKIEPLPWEPKCDGVSVYQVSDNADFSGDVMFLKIRRIERSFFVDEDGDTWSYCRPVPENQRVWGD